jgi:hypothetical protein
VVLGIRDDIVTDASKLMYLGARSPLPLHSARSRVSERFLPGQTVRSLDPSRRIVVWRFMYSTAETRSHQPSDAIQEWKDGLVAA